MPALIDLLGFVGDARCIAGPILRLVACPTPDHAAGGALPLLGDKFR